MRAGTNPLLNWLFVSENNEQPSWLPPTSITPSSSPYIADMQAPVTVPVLGFNVSELNYPANDPNGDPFGGNPAGTAIHPNTNEPIYPEAYDDPFDDLRFPADTTRLNEKRVHLQRLANPLLPYNAVTNPYRTIDAMNIDLTVFNGMAGSSGPEIPKDNANTRFSSRERGDSATGISRDLWSDQMTALRSTGAGAIATHYFNEGFLHSLGGLNVTFGTRFNKNYSDSTLSTAPVSVPADEFVGAPNSSASFGQPFPWLTWNNRPFVSQHELMLVPHSRSSRLLRNYSLVDPLNVSRVYDATSGEKHYGHLLNFFATRYFDTLTSTWTPGPDLYRLFDYTNVPSRFMGTETWLDPTTFASGPGTARLQPPFNRIFSFRETGKPNINTIFEPRVWDAVRGPNSTLTNFSTLIDSRRGYGVTGNAAVTMDATVPTFFGNAFRSADAGDLVPVESMMRAGVESTLLRSGALTASTTQTQTDAHFAVTSAGVHVEPNRNPYFRYQNIQRLSNLVTTRSNVYAIWVTMGFFEVTVENDGTGTFVERLGQEAGRETGEVKRHRAFYIVDRSIPVAFQPGENHNVDHAILLRRIIE